MRSGVEPPDPARPTGLISTTVRPSWSWTAWRIASPRRPPTSRCAVLPCAVGDREDLVRGEEPERVDEERDGESAADEHVGRVVDGEVQASTRRRRGSTAAMTTFAIDRGRPGTTSEYTIATRKTISRRQARRPGRPRRAGRGRDRRLRDRHHRGRAGADLRAASLHRRGGRRARTTWMIVAARRRRGVDHPDRAEGARGGRPSGSWPHNARAWNVITGRHQGEHPRPGRLRGVEPDRQPGHPRPARRREARRPGRHAAPPRQLRTWPSASRVRS